MIATIRWELRQRQTAILWWAFGSIVVSGLILLLYPPIRDQAAQFNQLFNQLPQGVRELKTGGTSTINVADPVAFLNSQLLYITLPIIWVILAITRVNSLLGRDEQDRTMELELSRPISRGQLLLAKALSLVIEFIIIGGLTLLAIVLIAPLFGLHIGTVRLGLAVAYTAAFSLSFGLIAFMLEATGGATRRIASMVAVILSFGSYLITSMSGLTSWLKIPSKLSPYHYFAPDKVMHGQTVHGLDIYLIGILVIASLLSYVGFRRRDIE